MISTAITTTIGAVVARAILRHFDGDSGLGDAFVSLIADRLGKDAAAREAANRIRDLGEEIAKSLIPFFEREGARLDSGDRVALARAVAETLDAITPDLIVGARVNARRLARDLIARRQPSDVALFSADATHLYRRIVIEACERIVSSASSLFDGFQEKAFQRILENQDVLAEATGQIRELLKRFPRLDAGLPPTSPGSAGVALVSPSVPVQTYLRALAARTADFVPPGCPARIPTERAKPRVRLLRHEAESDHTGRDVTLEVYLAAASGRAATSPADLSYGETPDTTTFGPHLVVLGDAGVGKSALCRALTYELARSGVMVMSVSLPQVLQRLQHHGGETLEEALVRVAADTHEAPGSPLWMALADAQWLIADGLDECGEHREVMAARLRTWAQTHPRARIIVTSRPQGYLSAYFPEWEHLEILPLRDAEAAAYVQTLLTAMLGNPDEARRRADRLFTRMKDNRFAADVARSPLLLGFLATLAAVEDERVDLPSTRAQLYRRLLEQWQDADRADRHPPACAPDPGIAERVLHLLGWTLQRGAGARGAAWDSGERAIVKEITRALAHDLGMPVLAAQELTRDALVVWQDRGVVARVRQGAEHTYTFTHPTLGEYVAGRYLSETSDQELRAAVRTSRRAPEWRATFLFAAGDSARTATTIVRELLSLDDSPDPTAVEVLMAASVLGEAQDLVAEDVEAVFAGLERYLTSSIPMLAGEAAEYSLALAARAPGPARALVLPLLDHPQAWTCHAALRLAIASCERDPEATTLDHIEAILDAAVRAEAHRRVVTRSKSGRVAVRVSEFQPLLGAAAPILAAARPTVSTARRLEEWASSPHNSVATLGGMQKAAAILHALAPDVPISIGRSLWSKVSDTLASTLAALSDPERWYRSDCGLLRVIEAACLRAGATNSCITMGDAEAPRYQLAALARLIAGVGPVGVQDSWTFASLYVPSSESPDDSSPLASESGQSNDIVGEADVEAAACVYRGGLAALAVDPDHVLTAVRWARQQRERGYRAWQARQEGRAPHGMHTGADLIADSNGSSDADSWKPATLYDLLPKAQSEPVWTRASGLGLPARALARALGSPARCIGISAASLIVAGAAEPRIGRHLMRVLRHVGALDDQIVLLIAWVVASLGPEDAADQLADGLRHRLELGDVEGATSVSRLLVDVSGEHDHRHPGQQVSAALWRALESSYAPLVREAARAVQRYGGQILQDEGPRMAGLLRQWSRDLERCPSCGGQTRSAWHLAGMRCASCQQNVENPRAALVGALGVAGSLSVGRLLRLCRDPQPDVVDEAVRCAVERLAGQQRKLARTIHLLHSGRYPQQLLSAILALPAYELRPHEEALVALAAAPDEAVRVPFVDAIGTAEWLPDERAHAIASIALTATSSRVRDHALVALRARSMNRHSDRSLL